MRDIEVLEGRVKSKDVENLEIRSKIAKANEAIEEIKEELLNEVRLKQIHESKNKGIID